ncbi:Trk system potassium transporter TrkA [Aerococcus urinaeequi]|uniref:Trk system potassium uptake protein TrkA n=1 Tax=Aerococcus urinaeequi TaxID=51665 RepID=A0A7M1KQ51_9LACT|nr:Trk system potassium transporter TrkA [Aerococcus urinaeequi]QOQ78353.1 Trk system potassium transporter TrkA [Aerococcus urinaeequi]
MDIVVVGGGKLGEDILHGLIKEGHNLTLIDNDSRVIDDLIDEVDIKGVVGNGVDVEVQREANVQNAQVFIAASPHDEVNIISAMIAKTLGAEFLIVRVRNQAFTAQQGFIQSNLGIDYLINQDRAAANDIIQVIDYPSATFVEPFYHNRMHLIKVRIMEKSRIVNQYIRDIRRNIPEVIVVAVERNGETLIPDGNAILLAGDFVEIFAKREALQDFFVAAGHKKAKRYRSALIVGGSRINHYLIPVLHARGIHTRLIELDKNRASELANQFTNTEVIYDDGTDQYVLNEQRVENFDLLLTLTNSDEENLMVSLYGKNAGVRKTITKVNRPGLIRLIDDSKLDVILSPRKAIVDAVTRHVRSIASSQSDKLENYARLSDNKTAVLEFVLSPDCKILDTPIKDMTFRPGLMIGLIVRNKEMIIPSGDDAFIPGDHVLVIDTEDQIRNFNDIVVNKNRRDGE